MNERVKILLIYTVVNKSLKEAIKSVSDFCEVKLIYSYELGKFEKEELSNLIEWADLILVDVRGELGVLNEVELKEKDLVALVGGSSLIAKAKLGKFRMPAKLGSSFVSDPASLKKRIENIQKAIETVGKILPFGVLKDARNYVKTLRYWANGGYENYRNMFLHLCKIKGLDVEVRDPLEFPDFGFYHPVYGFDYKPKSKNPQIGILFYGGMHFEQCQKTLEKMTSWFEERNLNVVSVYSDGILNLKALELLKDVDAIVSLLWFRLNGGPIGGDPKSTIELLKKKKAKFFTPALMFNQKLSDWEEAERGLNIVTLLPV